MGRVFKRGDIWYIDARAKGRRIRRRVGPSRKLAESALREVEAKLARDEFGLTKGDISLASLIEKFLEYHATNNRVSTAKRYKAIVDHFRRFLDAKSPDVVMLSQITPELMESYKGFRRNEWVNPNGKRIDGGSAVTESTRKGARARTVNLEVDGIKAMLNLAIEWGYLRENPLKRVKSLKEDDRKPFRYLTVDECTRLLEAASGDIYPIFYLFLNTGMRKAELINLQWSDVDLDRKRILIRRKEFWVPKTGEREIPMTIGVAKLLKKLKIVNDRGLKSEFVFSHTDGGRLKTKLRRRLIETAVKADIPDLTKIHSLRHTFASHLVMKGVDLPTVKKLLGHADIQTTMIYAHLAPDHLADAVNKLGLG